MAHVQQIIQWGEDSTQFVEEVPLRDGGQGIAPLSLLTFRGSAAIDGTPGSSDTFDARIVLPLPGAGVHQLTQFAMHIESAQRDIRIGKMELYVSSQPSLNTDSTQLDFPIIFEQDGRDMAQVGEERWSGTLAFGMFPGVLSPFNTPEAGAAYRVWCPGTSLGGANPVIDIGGGDVTNVRDATLRMSVAFLSYTVDQWRDTRLWSGISQR